MTAPPTIRVLGIDTALRSTGVAVVQAAGNRFSAVEHGNIRNAATLPLSGCLRKLSDEISLLIHRTSPDAVAIEGIFFARNAKTATRLGEARGAVIAACACHGLPVYEYSPRRIKQALVGFGAAGKEQVRKMVMTLLNMRESPQEDAGDALAIALCHLHNRSTHEALKPKPI